MSVYYSDKSAFPSENYYDLKWTNPSSSIRISDPTSKDKVFKLKKLYLSFYSDFYIILKITPKFLSAEALKLSSQGKVTDPTEDAKSKIKNLAQYFNNQIEVGSKLKKNSKLENAGDSKRKTVEHETNKRLKYFEKMTKNKELINNEQELAKRPFLRDLLVIFHFF